MNVRLYGGIALVLVGAVMLLVAATLGLEAQDAGARSVLAQQVGLWSLLPLVSGAGFIVWGTAP